MVVGFIMDVEFLWGFQARIVGLSKTSPSFYYPPPTTILGALAEVIAKTHRIGEKEGRKIIPFLSRKLLAIGFRPINCIPIKYEDVNRIIAVKITGASKKLAKIIGSSRVIYPHPKNLAASFDAPARGKTLLSTLNDSPPMIRVFLVFKDEKIEFYDRKLRINENYFWKIHRLGSKESRTSIIRVSKVTSLQLGNGRITTNYCFPLFDGIAPVMEKMGSWEQELYVNPFTVGAYDERENPVINYIMGRKVIPFKIPILKGVLNVPKYVLELNENFVSYKHDEEVIVGKWYK